ncbi:MAG: ParB/RepB/Spo0J family partition protein [Chloroflexi bacterium]|nr:ParB/RepB/Spo0J family partition protein [Chloroflexota bacterium]MCY3938891.1 ParB/RepB/Spo0J family partition protein [Chloroflexota bacterium]
MRPRHSGALGRGLEALLPKRGVRLVEAKLSSIRRGRHQPRVEMNAARLDELTDSIRRHGVLQPLVVTEESDGSGSWYELVAGERRWRAAKAAALETVPVIVKTVDEVSRLQIGLVENLQREDLGATERANAYSVLIREFGMTQEEIARAVGKSRPSVANTLRLLELTDEARKALQQRRISEGHARALLSIRNPKRQIELLRAILEGGLTVREAEEAAKASGTAIGDETNVDRADLEGRLRSKLGTKVQLMGSRGSGRMVIHYYSQEELETLVDVLLGEDVVSRETT